MAVSTQKIKAKYDSGTLLVTEHGLDLPILADSMPLLAYLYVLSARDIDDWYAGWRAVQAAFMGYEITLEMESFEISQARSFPLYLVQKTEISYPGNFEIKVVEKLKEPLLQENWRELATSQQLISESGSRCVITLWTKDSFSWTTLGSSFG